MSNPLQQLTAICALYDEMLECANRLDWDAVATKWQEVEPLFSQFRAFDLSKTQPTYRAETAQLIEKAMSLQEQIKARVEPWLDDVRPLLEAFSRPSLTKP